MFPNIDYRKLLLLFAFWVALIPAYSLNIKIIESQSKGHSMDQIWLTICQGMGHNTAIYGQSSLNDSTFYLNADLLIISSGVIPLSSTQVNTVRKAMQAGIPVYLQSEYSDTFSTNMAFQSLVNYFGGTFAWTGQTLPGSFSPTVIGSFSNTPDTVTSLKFSYYSAKAVSGCDVQVFLRIGTTGHGYFFAPDYLSCGAIATIPDQDWIVNPAADTISRNRLMRNIVVHLTDTSFRYPVQPGSFTVNLGADTTRCKGEVHLLDAGYTDATYLWQNGDTSRVFAAVNSGIYSVMVTRSGFNCPVIDSIKLTFYQVPLNLGPDRNICQGDEVVFNLTGNNLQGITWQDGKHDSIYKTKLPGTYYVVVTNGSCFSRDTVVLSLKIPAPINLQDVYDLCHGDSLVLDLTGKADHFTWDDGDTSAVKSFYQASVYYVSYSNSPCPAITDTFMINMLPIPFFVLPDDTFLCSGKQLVLKPGITQVQYLWQDGSTDSFYLADKSGTYFVTASNTCGNYTDSIQLSDCPCKFTIQNVFTPDGNRINDMFMPEGCFPADYRLIIYNRWGEALFESASVSIGWDGTFNGQPVSEGVYFWVIDYTENNQSVMNHKVKHGTITLLR